MPERDWGIHFAIGLIVIALTCVWAAFYIGSEVGETRGERDKNTTEYERHAEEQIRSACLSGEGGDIAECVSKIIKSTNEDSRAESDLVAQTEMARWAFYMLIATVGVAIITGAGVYYVWQTLRVTRDIGQAQARAYLAIKVGDVTQKNLSNVDGSNVKVSVELEISNVGNSPAQYVEVFYFIGEGINGEIFSVNLEQDGGKTPTTHSFLACGGVSISEVSRVWRVDDRDNLFARAERFVRLIYAVRYTDVFGEKCETPITSGVFSVGPSGDIRFISDHIRDIQSQSDQN